MKRVPLSRLFFVVAWFALLLFVLMRCEFRLVWDEVYNPYGQKEGRYFAVSFSVLDYEANYPPAPEIAPPS